jgi:hypothetical protein
MVNLLLNSGASLLNGTPVIYLTQWKIVGNSEVHGNEIWSCGEYNATDGKYHILVQPLGGSIADIALTEPLRKVNDVADIIEFPSETESKALVTRNLKQIVMSSLEWRLDSTGVQDSHRYLAPVSDAYAYTPNEIVLTMNTGGYKNSKGNDTWFHIDNTKIIGMYRFINGYPVPNFAIYDPDYDKEEDLSAFLTYLADKLIIYRLAIPTTELVDAPQIEEAESYSCVISQGAKAVSWSGFTTE